jgi:2-polyprenyl-3-methyl-5-hydroxy-6-metoxy-1,4-benzoquinol methylase
MNRTSSLSDYLHDATVPDSSQFLYIPIRNILLKSKIQTVLDIGCGNGSLAKYLANSIDIKIVGIDPSESGIENARKILPQNKFYCMGIYDDPGKIENEKFDAIISTEVIEHLFYPRVLLQFAKSKLKNNGLLIISTPYHGYLKNVILSLLGKWDIHHNPLWDGGHIKYWSKNTLSQLLSEEGFIVDKFVGCGRIPYVWKSMLLVSRLK